MYEKRKVDIVYAGWVSECNIDYSFPYVDTESSAKININDIQSYLIYI